MDWEEALGGPRVDATELAAETVRQREAAAQAEARQPEEPARSRRHRRNKT